jgi:dihydrodipicolinate synthase/N-acetylneuraminate lyase
MAFEGIRPVLQLPLGAEPEQPVVHGELRGLVERMVAAGVDGLVVLGLGSEAWTLREAERDEVVETVAMSLGGRLPLVVGLDGTTAVAVDRARRATAAGAAGLMVLPPAGARTTDQLVRHYVSVADAAGVPLLIQDPPATSGIALGLDTVLGLARAHPLLRSLKVELLGAGARTSAAGEAGIEIVAGWGGLLYLEQVARGATGCMPGCDLGPAFVAIDRRARSGDGATAADLYRRILPLLSWSTQSLDLLLLGAKRHLRRAGVFSSDALRAPGRVLDAVEIATLDTILDGLAADGVPGFGTP